METSTLLRSHGLSPFRSPLSVHTCKRSSLGYCCRSYQYYNVIIFLPGISAAPARAGRWHPRSSFKAKTSGSYRPTLPQYAPRCWALKEKASVAQKLFDRAWKLQMPVLFSARERMHGYMSTWYYTKLLYSIGGMIVVAVDVLLSCDLMVTCNYTTAWYSVPGTVYRILAPAVLPIHKT